MATPNGAATTARASFAALDAQVKGLDRDYQDLKRTLLDLDAKIDQSIASIGNRFENALSSLANKVEQKNTTQWPVIFSGLGVVLTILTVLGTMAYLPIQHENARLDTAVSAILDRGVFQREYSADQNRTAELLRNLRADLNITVQQQRYNTDQERLTKLLDDLKTGIEVIRLRSYEMNGRMSKMEQSQTDINNRYEAVSNRLAQQIRDFSAAMREIDRGGPQRKQP